MATEWGVINLKKEKDNKIVVNLDESGATIPVADMPDFTLKFYIENRETSAITATKVGEVLTGCYESGGFILVNIPADTFAAGRMVVAQEPSNTDATFTDGTFDPSKGTVTDITFF